MQARRHVELADLGGGLEPLVAALDEHPPVGERPYGLDRVQRDPFRPGDDPAQRRARQTADQPLEQLRHGLRTERLEHQRGRVGDPGRPAGPALRELGPGEGADEDRMLARPLEQPLDEVEQLLVGPLHVLEQERHRVVLGKAFENNRQDANSSARSSRGSTTPISAPNARWRRRRSSRWPPSARAPRRAAPMPRPQTPLRRSRVAGGPISASARSATPSPNDRHRPECQSTS